MSGSNARAGALQFRWPPDLAQVITGAAPAREPVKRPPSDKTRTEQELIDQIAAQPLDDAARRVYADLLTERNDPRGEFITLQLLGELDAKQTKRMRALERAGWPAWLGPLGRLVEKPRFERGFLAACTLGSTKTAFDAWQHTVTPRALAELAAVRALELAPKFPPDIARELLEKLTLLQRVIAAPSLLAEAPRRIPTLAIRAHALDISVAIATVARRHPDELCVILKAMLATALRTHVPPLFGRPAPAARLAFECGETRVVLRSKDDRLAVLEVDEAEIADDLCSAILPELIEACPNRSLTRIVVRVPASDAALDVLRKWCARLGCEVVRG